MKTVPVIFALLVLGISSYAEVSQKVLSRLDPVSREQVVQTLGEAEELGLPGVPLERKIMEGLAKGKTGEEIVKAMQYRLAIMKNIVSDGRRLNPGAFPEALFKHEKKSIPKPKVAATPRKPAPRVKPPVAPVPVLEPEPRTDIKGRGPKPVEKKFQDKTDKYREKTERLMEKKADKQEKHLEKKQEILEKKLQKKQEQLEKALEKKKKRK